MGKSVDSKAIIDKVKDEVNFSFKGVTEAMMNYQNIKSIENAINVLISVGYQVMKDKPEVYVSHQSFTATKYGKDGLTFHFTSVSLLEFADKLMAKYYQDNL